MGLERAFPNVGPANVKGIELNAYAAELAVWIGEIQWMRRNGFPGSRQPILDPLETIECRDAILTPDGGEPEWPEADVIIGNPPFLGGKLRQPRRGIRLHHVRCVQGPGAARGRSGLLLVRKGWRASGPWSLDAGWTGRDQLDPGWSEPRRTGMGH